FRRRSTLLPKRPLRIMAVDPASHSCAPSCPARACYRRLSILYRTRTYKFGDGRGRPCSGRAAKCMALLEHAIGGRAMNEIDFVSKVPGGWRSAPAHRRWLQEQADCLFDFFAHRA